jgi:uncharacterized protein (UPF0548 family)
MRRLTEMGADLSGQLSAAELTYQEVGQATAGRLPPGYHHLRRSTVIGGRQDLFGRTGAALFSWQPQLRAGLSVCASTPTAEPGTVVLLSARMGPLRISAPCRVVRVVTEPGIQGFAYGTLPGHPESGEEAFVVEQLRDGTVTVTITAFSRPATLARAAGPLGRVIQRHMTSRYLRALDP